MKDPLLKYTLFIVSVIATVYILIIGKALIIPLVLAVVIWYFIVSLARFFEKYRIPRSISMLFSIISCLLILLIFYSILSKSIKDLLIAAPTYQVKLESLIAQFLTWSGLERTDLINNITGSINFGELVKKGTEVFTTFASNIMLILIYLLFLLLEYKGFKKKMRVILDDNEDYAQTKQTLARVSAEVNTYMKVKTLVSLITGIVSYIVLVAIGVDFPEFWAFLLFILNYIPTIGSLIGVLFPVILSAIQFPSLVQPITTLVLLTVIQVVTSNVMEPRMMGRSLNLSPLVIILSLAVWGAIWGIVGMILCVPITVIMNIIFSKFEKTRALAVLLSEKGEVKQN